MTLKIGNVELANPFLMAPLAGITDAPMRRIAHEAGAALTYSEMVSAKGLWYKDKNTEKLLEIYGDEKPVAFQLFGSEPEIMRFAADKLADRENALLDINMGCPVPKVVRNGEGSALMQDPDLVCEIVRAAVEGALAGARRTGREPKPVTVKMRLGFTDDRINAVEVAQAASAGGAAAVCVHGRTRPAYYSGKADWDAIAKVREAVSIPVIANGDVFSGEDAIAIMKRTGCDMVMIARGALGNPWIFRDAIALWKGQELPAGPTPEDRVDALLRHFSDLITFKGEYAGVREMRKQIGWYLKGLPGSAEIRRNTNNITNAEEMREILVSYGRRLK